MRDTADLLPFQTSHRLQHLFSQQHEIQLDAVKISSEMPNLTSLAWADATVLPRDVAKLNLQKLQKLRIGSFVTQTQDAVLSQFTALQR